MLRNFCPRVQVLLRQGFNDKVVNKVMPQTHSPVCKECQRQFSNISRKIKWMQKYKKEVVSAWQNYSSQTKPPQNPQSVVQSSTPEAAQNQSTSQIPPADPNTVTMETDDTKIIKDPKIVKIKNKKIFNTTYLDNIYIEPGRAIVDYLLAPRELEKLTKYSRRSPYGSEKSFVVYRRKDVEEIAIKKFGSLEYLSKERKRRNTVESFAARKFPFFDSNYRERTSTLGYDQLYGFVDPTTVTSVDGLGVNASQQTEEQKKFFQTGSGQVVLTAIGVNFANALIKFIAWAYTGSHSLFSEMIHSIADTVNQIILGIGLYSSHKKADSAYPYGYSNLRHVSSLISGVGIFCIGTGFSVYHGIQGLLYPQQMESLYWALGTLAGSFVSEGASLVVAFKQVHKKSKREGITFWQYVWRGYDPNVTVVLLEDMAAISGVAIAAGAIGLTYITGNPVYDSIGSIGIGALLATVAFSIIRTNSAALLIRSIPLEKKTEISDYLEQDRMIRSLHDVKATEMGGQIKFKAEVDFDGREITGAYVYKLDMDQVLKEMQEMKTQAEAEEFILKHGQKILDSLGGEIDRIEKVIKAKYPEVRHVDLEAL